MKSFNMGWGRIENILSLLSEDMRKYSKYIINRMSGPAPFFDECGLRSVVVIMIMFSSSSSLLLT